MPGNKYWHLTIKKHFSASHALRCFKGKCENLHGHNFGVEMTVSGSKLERDAQILMDFGDLKRALKEVLNTLDHKHLNEVPPFDTINPSSENLSQYIFQHVAPLVESETVTLVSITVSEKDGQSATYFEGEGRQG